MDGYLFICYICSELITALYLKMFQHLPPDGVIVCVPCPLTEAAGASTWICFNIKDAKLS